jgi:phospholipid/cholesterol/gamma-HCH transport system substrate-binding protein
MPSQERVAWAKIRVGAVTVAALTILLTLIYLLSGGTLFEEKATLYLYIPDATGLGTTSPVTVDGITVGKIKSVGLSGSGERNRVIRVLMTVERSQLRTIPADSNATVDSLTMIGDKYIAITTGRAPTSIRAGAELTYREIPDLTKRLDMRQFEQQLREIDAVLTDIEQGRSRVGQFILGDQVYLDVQRRLLQIQESIRITTSRSTTIGQALYGDALYRQVSDTINGIDQGLAKLQSGQGAMGPFLRDPAQYEQILSQLRDLHQAVSDLRASDFIRSDAQHAEWNKELIALIQAVDEANVSPLLNSTADYERYGGMARDLANTLRDFRSDPRKFLRLKVF